MRTKVMRRWIAAAVVVIVLLIGTAGILWYWNQYNKQVNNRPAQSLLQVQSAEVISDNYDVIVAGTDPEGVAAAVSAARNGLRVLLVEGKDRDRLGGLMTVGWLNTLDLNFSPKQPRFLQSIRKPVFLNKGIFQEWYDIVDGTSFDVNRAANAFYTLVQKEPGIDLLMQVQAMEPLLLEEQTVAGLRIVLQNGNEQEVHAPVVIDATQDADVAAATGAPYTLGRDDIGIENSLMVSTLVFKLSGVTNEVWKEMTKYPDAGYDKMSIWGYNEAREYQSSDPSRIKLRGLNIGRQDDETILINAIQLFGVDPLDPESVKQGMAVAEREVPLIVEFLKTRFEGFRNVEYAGTAPELYIRESRHIIGEYRLNIRDMLENRNHWDAIAYGSYPIDIQSTSSGEGGTILMQPEQYGVPFRSLVPLDIDGLLVVGRAASFDTLPHGSARVIPLGMATGEAAGVAARLALEEQVTFRELSRSEAAIKKLQSMLVKQGMDLKMNKFAEPAYMSHPAYEGLVTAVGLYLTSGSYSNDAWNLDSASNVQRFYNSLRRIRAAHSEQLRTDFAEVIAGTSVPSEQPLTLERAAYMILGSVDKDAAIVTAIEELLYRGWLQQQTLERIEDPQQLTNGDVFMLLHDFAGSYLNVRFE